MGSAGQRLIRIHLDPLMLAVLLTILGYGLVVLYSAVDRNLTLFGNQAARIGLALALMVAVAQIHPRVYLRWTPVAYVGGFVLLLLVLLVGVEAKGSRRCSPASMSSSCQLYGMPFSSMYQRGMEARLRAPPKRVTVTRF